MNQYGETKGTSVSHYLNKMLTFILYNQEFSETKAVIAAIVNFEKAFNTENHEIIVTKHADMNVAAWLLKIIIGFISERILLVAYKGGESEEKYMPEGGPQGTVLNLVCYYSIYLIIMRGTPEREKQFHKR